MVEFLGNVCFWEVGERREGFLDCREGYEFEMVGRVSIVKKRVRSVFV